MMIRTMPASLPGRLPPGERLSALLRTASTCATCISETSPRRHTPWAICCLVWMLSDAGAHAGRFLATWRSASIQNSSMCVPETRRRARCTLWQRAAWHPSPGLCQRPRRAPRAPTRQTLSLRAGRSALVSFVQILKILMSATGRLSSALCCTAAPSQFRRRVPLSCLS